MSSSLPLQAIDRLFQRLHSTYGRQFEAMWGTADPNSVKSVWSHELAGFASRLDRIAWALEHLPERCPNAIEFRNLCRQAPTPDEPRLPEPKADPERVKAELAKLGGLRLATAAQSSGQNPHKDWARRLIARHQAGEKIRPISLQFAREALGVNAHAEAA